MESYRFGKFAIRLAGTWKKSNFWRSFLTESADKNALVIAEQDGKQISPVSGNGWQWERECATFLLDGKPLFSITLKAPNEAFVQGGSLGILYALLLSRVRDCVGLHGITVRCGGKTVILSTTNGGGKTTFLMLLQQIPGVEIINGDFALLSWERDGRVFFEPTPFCGSSGICQNLRLPVDQIVFLRPGAENSFVKLPVRQACVYLLDNTFIPDWDAKRSKLIFVNALKMLEHLSVCQYSFTPDESAVTFFQQNIP